MQSRFPTEQMELKVRLRAAGRTLKKLPDREAGRLLFALRSSWPAILRDPTESYGYSGVSWPRLRATGTEIDELDRMLDLLVRLDLDQRSLLLAWAVGATMSDLAERDGISPRTIWRRWREALERLHAVSLSG